MATEPRIEDDAVEIYKQLEVYPWNSDKEFLVSFRSIFSLSSISASAMVKSLFLP
jgi:hypothetical protein